MRNLLRLLPLALMAFALTACYEPLEYELVINVSDTGAYDMRFDGTIGLYAIEFLAQGGASPEEVEGYVAEAEAEIAAFPGVEAYEHRGGSVFYLRAADSFTETSTSVIFDFEFMSVERGPGLLSFTTEPWDEEAHLAFADFGYEHGGHIILRTSADVIESNGKRGPRGHYWDKELLELEGMRIILATP